MTQFIKVRRAALALTIATLTGLVGQSAFAGVPEIVIDQRTSKVVPHPDLESALIEVSFPFSFRSSHVEVQWRGAPWFAG